jgi:hypothetical protein
MNEFLAGFKDFSLQSVHTGCVADPDFHAVCSEVIFPLDKANGVTLATWPPSSAEVKNEWSYTLSCPSAFMALTEACLM